MERRTSCLQSNVDFLQKTIAKLTADHQQKLDAANRQIESLKLPSAACKKPWTNYRRRRRSRRKSRRRKMHRRLRKIRRLRNKAGYVWTDPAITRLSLLSPDPNSSRISPKFRRAEESNSKRCQMRRLQSRHGPGASNTRSSFP